ncbi:TOBE domain-containing protein [Persephonella sp.]
MKKFDTEIFLNLPDKRYIGKGRIELLELIDKYGSISKAAKELKMSYKTAWDNLDAINNMSPQPVIISKSGGSGGGKTYLTDYGKTLIRQYRKVEEFINKLSDKINEFLEEDKIEDFVDMYKRLNMCISARNQLLSTIQYIKSDNVTAEIISTLQDGQTIRSLITYEAVKRLNLKQNDQVFMIIKATDVMISLPENLSISTENRIFGKIERIINGKVNCEVKIKSGNNIITSVVTKGSMEKFGLKKGDNVVALIKPSDILVGKL